MRYSSQGRWAGCVRIQLRGRGVESGTMQDNSWARDHLDLRSWQCESTQPSGESTGAACCSERPSEVVALVANRDLRFQFLGCTLVSMVLATRGRKGAVEMTRQMHKGGCAAVGLAPL